jgi:membrane protease subunit (stomatin/prohibitin family)
VSILEKLRSELVDIVEWVDDDRHALVWRFPRYHNQIKNGARLIVRPGQQAVFVHQGRLADVFRPGTHVLETSNLPVLSNLAGWMHGFDSPFKAEVYFVATRQIADLKWGTPNPVTVRDPDFGPIRVRAFGTYTLKAVEPRRLLEELVGTDQKFEADEVAELVRSIIAATFAEIVAGSDLCAVDLASRTREMSERVRTEVAPRLKKDFGLDVPQLWLVNVSFPEEVERALDARAGMSVVADLARYQQYQVGAATPIAAANPAGGIAGAGVGVGLGLAIARGPGGFADPGAPARGASPPPLPTAVSELWHMAEGGQAVGPFSRPQLAEAAAAGRLRPETLVWAPGMSSWIAAAQVAALAVLFAPPLPPAR